MTITYKELREKILHRLDPDDLLDILQISSEDLLDRFDDRVLEYMYKFDFLHEDDLPHEVEFDDR